MNMLPLPFNNSEPSFKDLIEEQTDVFQISQLDIIDSLESIKKIQKDIFDVSFEMYDLQEEQFELAKSQLFDQKEFMDEQRRALNNSRTNFGGDTSSNNNETVSKLPGGAGGGSNGMMGGALGAGGAMVAGGILSKVMKKLGSGPKAAFLKGGLMAAATSLIIDTVGGTALDIIVDSVEDPETKAKVRSIGETALKGISVAAAFAIGGPIAGVVAAVVEGIDLLNKKMDTETKRIKDLTDPLKTPEEKAREAGISYDLPSLEEENALVTGGYEAVGKIEDRNMRNVLKIEAMNSRATSTLGNVGGDESVIAEKEQLMLARLLKHKENIDNGTIKSDSARALGSVATSMAVALKDYPGNPRITNTVKDIVNLVESKGGNKESFIRQISSKLGDTMVGGGEERRLAVEQLMTPIKKETMNSPAPSPLENVGGDNSGVDEKEQRTLAALLEDKELIDNGTIKSDSAIALGKVAARLAAALKDYPDNPRITNTVKDIIDLVDSKGGDKKIFVHQISSKLENTMTEGGGEERQRAVEQLMTPIYQDRKIEPPKAPSASVTQLENGTGDEITNRKIEPPKAPSASVTQLENGTGGKIPNSVTQVGSDSNFGSIAARFESNGKPGTISTGKGDHGGKSYGMFQLASRGGASNNEVEKFLNESGYSEKFNGMKVGSSEFDAQWKKLAKEDSGFGEAQSSYAKKSYYDPQMKNLQRSGIDLSGKGRSVQESIMSTANQYGPNTDLIREALKGKDPTNMTDKEIVNAIQDYKADTVDTRFRSSSEKDREGVARRIERERTALLNFPDDKTAKQLMEGPLEGSGNSGNKNAAPPVIVDGRTFNNNSSTSAPASPSRPIEVAAISIQQKFSDYSTLSGYNG